MELLDPLVQLFGGLAIFIVGLIALWRLIFTPRKRRMPDGKERERSAIVTPGWVHDATVDELENVRIAHARILKEMRDEFDRRVTEWRQLRDEERARAVESDSRLREMDKRLDRFDDVLEQMLDLLTELAEGASVVGAE